MNKIKAIFFDIDGTLVSFKTHRVPEENIEALKELRRKGIKVFISTGRMIRMIGVVNGLEFDGYVANNGATCFDSCKHQIFSRPLPQSQLDALAERLEDKALPQFALSFMGNENYYLNTPSETASEIARQVNVAPPELMPVRDIIRKEIYQLCIYLQGKPLQRIMDTVLTGCEASSWNPLFADVNEKGITKQYGIDRMLEHYGIDLSQTMSFGDGANDIPMLKHTAVSVCMGNATPDVISASDYKTGTVDESGITEALVHYGLL